MWSSIVALRTPKLSNKSQLMVKNSISIFIVDSSFKFCFYSKLFRNIHVQWLRVCFKNWSKPHDWLVPHDDYGNWRLVRLLDFRRMMGNLRLACWSVSSTPVANLWNWLYNLLSSARFSFFTVLARCLRMVWHATVQARI